jgi:hypothetical protein
MSMAPYPWIKSQPEGLRWDADLPLSTKDLVDEEARKRAA